MTSQREALLRQLLLEARDIVAGYERIAGEVTRMEQWLRQPPSSRQTGDGSEESDEGFFI